MAITFKSEKLEKHQEMAQVIKENLKAEGTKISEEESHGAYYKTLPEGLTQDVVKEVAKHNQNFVAATHVAIGEMAADIFNTDKSAETVTAQVGFFGARDKITATVDREKVFRNSFATNEEDKEIKKSLVMRSTIDTSGSGLKSIREAMSEEFKERFN